MHQMHISTSSLFSNAQTEKEHEKKSKERGKKTKIGCQFFFPKSVEVKNCRRETVLRFEVN